MADLVPAKDLPTQTPMPQALPQAAVNPAEVPHDDMPQMEVPDADMPDAHTKKPINNSKAFVEGMGRSMTFGGTDLMQHSIRNIADHNSENPDLWADSDQDVAKRKDSIAGKIGEGVGLVAGLLTGTGAPGLISKGAKALTPAATSILGKLGAATLSGALESGMIQTGDEVSNSLLGKGDPEAPVSSALAHIGGAMLLGGATSGGINIIGQSGNKALIALENAKMGTQAQDVLTGMGMAAKAKSAGVPVEKLKDYVADYKRYKVGIDLYENGARQAVGKATKGTADTVAAVVGFKTAGPLGAWVAGKATDKLIAPTIEKIMDKPLIGTTNKLVIPTIMYALSKGQTSGLFNALNHATAVGKGAKAIGKGVDAIFKAGSEQVGAVADPKHVKKIMDYIDNGGIDKEMSDSMQEAPPEPEQGFAEGGEIPEGMDPAIHQQTDGGSIASLYPEQDMMLSAAKGRVSNYLSSLKPVQSPQKLPFDRAPDMKDTEKEYHAAVGIAASPLSILNHVKDGTLQASQVKDFTSMYPELHQYLSKKLTEKLIGHQLEEETIPYKTRLALSLFMGTALDSTMKPEAIMAAQQAFMIKPTPPQQPAPNKKSKGAPGKLGKDNKSYKTASQAAESDRSNRD